MTKKLEIENLKAEQLIKPSVQTMAKIAKALGVSVDDLVNK